MFKEKKNEKYEGRLSNLENEIWKESHKASGFSMFGEIINLDRPTFRGELKNLQKEVRNNRDLFDYLLDHLKLEYHRVTDENGQIVVKHQFRKKKPAKKSALRSDYSYED